jgi:hypothetical protein
MEISQTGGEAMLGQQVSAVLKKHFLHNRANAMVEMLGVRDLSALQHKVEVGVLGLLLELEQTW